MTNRGLLRTRRAFRRAGRSCRRDLDQAGALLRACGLIGVELTAPTLVNLADINKILKEYGLDPIKEATLKPLIAA